MTRQITFTAEQRQAIETIDRSVLVSAAAGSGKTAVLAERCAHLVCDAPAETRCDIDELAVVTFTENAARRNEDPRPRGDPRTADATTARRQAS